MTIEDGSDIQRRSCSSSKRASYATDRRAYVRYPIELDLWFRATLEDGTALTGTGRSVNISSHGMLLRSDVQLKADAHIYAEVKWPARSEDGPPLVLAISGRILRCVGTKVALRIRRHGLVPAHDRARLRLPPIPAPMVLPPLTS